VMKTFLQLINESTSISDIIQKENMFIMIIGGVASGKSYVYEKHFSSIPLIDIDEYTERWSNGDWEKARKLVSKAIKAVESDIKKVFLTGKSVVNTGSGAGVNGVLNKFRWASDAGYSTAIVLVDVPLETALKRNQKRANDGGRNLIPDYKVERTNNAARENFKEFSKIADYSIRIKT